MAVERLKSCDNIVALSKQLRVPRRNLYRWRDELDPIAPREESLPQNSRESTLRKEVHQLKQLLADKVLGDRALAADPGFATNVERVKRRAETDAKVQAVFGATDEAALAKMLAAADIAFARVNDPALLAVHPHLRRIEVGTPSGPVSYPAPAARRDGEPRRYGPVPAIGEHSARIWAEFLPKQ